MSDEMIPKGTYRARAESWDLGFTSSGKEQVGVVCHLIDIGQRIAWYGYFTEKSTPYTIAALRAFGFRGTDLSDLTGLDAEVELVIDHETYEGKTRAKIKFVNTPGGGAILKAPMDDPSKRAFAARMKGAFVAHDKTAPAPAPKPVPYQPADNGDIPF